MPSKSGQPRLLTHGDIRTSGTVLAESAHHGFDNLTCSESPLQSEVDGAHELIGNIKVGVDVLDVVIVL